MAVERRLVVKIQAPRVGAPSSGIASSTLTHYIAWDGVDREHEGAGPRPLFASDGQDNLTYCGADHHLSGGQGAPAKRDLMHLIVSVKSEDYDALGMTEEERSLVFRQVGREGMEELKRYLRDYHSNLKDYRSTESRKNTELRWKWVGGEHLNTDKPHMHFAINIKDLIEWDPTTGEERHLEVGMIPKEILPPSKKSRDLGDRPVEGLIGCCFADALDRAKERARDALLERSLLGMDQSTTFLNLKFESPLVHQGIKYWTTMNYYAAMMVTDADLDLRRLIASSSPEEAREIGGRLDRLRQLDGHEAKLTKDKEAELMTIDSFMEVGARIRQERREVIDALPGEAKALVEKAHLRTNWPRIQEGVLWTAVWHGYGPGTPMYDRLLSTGDRDLHDGTDSNLLGKFMMLIRGARKNKNSKEAPSQTAPLPLADRCRSSEDILREIRNRYEPNEPMPSKLVVGQLLKSEVPIDRTLFEKVAAEALSDLARRNPSLGGRELTSWIINLGPAPEPGSPPDVYEDIREVLKGRSLDDPEYVPRNVWGDVLKKEYSQELSWLYQTGGGVKDGKVAYFPGEGHEFSGANESNDPFITELNYAFKFFGKKNQATAVKFHDLAKRIAGEADGKGQFGYFKYFYDQLKRDANGAYLDYRDKEGRQQALERTLEYMRRLAPEMEQAGLTDGGERSTDLSPEEDLSVEEMNADELDRKSSVGVLGTDGGSLSWRHDDEASRSLFQQEVDERQWMIQGRSKGADIAADDSRWFDSDDDATGEIDDSEQTDDPDDYESEDVAQEFSDESSQEDKREDKYENRDGSFVFNTAARMSPLGNNRLRFPAGLTYEDRRSLVGIHFPNLDAKIEAGRRRDDILRDISLMVLDWNINLSEDGAERERLQYQNWEIGGLLRLYLIERFKDPETRALNESEEFRNSHERIIAARTPEELIPAVDDARNNPHFNERQRRLLLCGYPSDTHNSQMREIRLTGWLTLNERVQALSEGKLPMSRQLSALLAELDSRNSEGRVNYFFASITTHPDEMKKPQESRERGIWEKVEQLPLHEFKFLHNETWAKKQSFYPQNPSLRETAPRIGVSQPVGVADSRNNESLRVYRASVDVEGQRLIAEIVARRVRRALLLSISEDPLRQLRLLPLEDRVVLKAGSFSRPSILQREVEENRDRRALLLEPGEARKFLQDIVKRPLSISEDLLRQLRARPLEARFVIKPIRFNRRSISQWEIEEIRARAVKLAFNRLVPEELLVGPLEGRKEELSNTIATIQEEVQPKLRLAIRARKDFYLEKIGVEHPTKPAHFEALKKLDVESQRSIEAFNGYVEKLQTELYRGFDRIDRLRTELAQAPGSGVVEMEPPVVVESGTRDAQVVTRTDRKTGDSSASSVQPDMGQDDVRPGHPQVESPNPALTMGSAPEGVTALTPGEAEPAYPARIDSYREFCKHVAEIERQMISEVLERRSGPESNENNMRQSDGLLTPEDKVKMRAAANERAFARLESATSPERIFTDDPAVGKILTLGEVIARLRDETHPQAREAARRLDEFIRSRGLDRSIQKKTDYFYRGDQVDRGELKKLSIDDQRDFVALKDNAESTLAELRSGFKTIDALRLDIDKERADGDWKGANAPAQATGHVPGEIRSNPIRKRDGNSLPESAADFEVELMNDRRKLGDLIIAEARADCAVHDYELARDRGRTFRFRIRDESVEAERRISDLDVNQRADARGERTADEFGATRRYDRLAIRGQVSAADIQHHSSTLEEHGKKLTKLVSELGAKAKEALGAYHHAQGLTQEVAEKYRKLEEPLPEPFIKRKDLIETQGEVVNRGFAEHTEQIEQLLETLAEEHGKPMRSDREAAWLVAQVFAATTELKAREERARRFDETRHLQYYEIGGERLSLVEIDRRGQQLSDQAGVIGVGGLNLNSESRRQAKDEIERLGEVRKQVIEQIGARRVELKETVDEASKLLETLSHAQAREAVLREKSGLSMPKPEFTRRQLTRCADNIETIKDEVLLRELTGFERQFNRYADPKERFSSAEGWGLAPARAVMADVFCRESSERLTAFQQRAEVLPLLIETSDGNLITYKLGDARPQSLLEFFARPIFEPRGDREFRQAVEQAAIQRWQRLDEDFKKACSYAEVAHELSSAQSQERALRAGQDLPPPEPAFSAKQEMYIDKFAERQIDPGVREHYLSLSRRSALSHFDSQTRTNSPEPAVERGR